MRSEVKAAIAVGLVVFVGAIIWAVNSTKKADNIPFDLPVDEVNVTPQADLVADATPVRSTPTVKPKKTEQPSVLSYEPVTIPPQTAEPKRPADDSGAAATLIKPEPTPSASEPPTASAPADLNVTKADVDESRAEAVKPAPSAPPRQDDRLRTLQKPPPRGSKYTIELGDTFSSIAREQYGADKYHTAIQAANPDADPNSLRVGQVITLPPKEEVLRETAKTAGNTKPSDALTYVVEPGDSLIAIARNVLKDESRYLEIFELNRDKLESPDNVPAGIELRLPPLKKKSTTENKPKNGG